MSLSFRFTVLVVAHLPVCSGQGCKPSTRIAVLAIAVAAGECDQPGRLRDHSLGICRLAARWPKLYQVQMAVSARSQTVRVSVGFVAACGRASLASAESP